MIIIYAHCTHKTILNAIQRYSYCIYMRTYTYVHYTARYHLKDSTLKLLFKYNMSSCKYIAAPAACCCGILKSTIVYCCSSLYNIRTEFNIEFEHGFLCDYIEAVPTAVEYICLTRTRAYLDKCVCVCVMCKV